jgi:hypothetical protein
MLQMTRFGMLPKNLNALGSRTAIKRGADNEDEDMDGDYQYGQTGRP